MELSKYEIIELTELIGTGMYHASPGVPMYDIIELFEVIDNDVYFNFVGKDYGQRLPINEINTFLNFEPVFMSPQMHAMGFEIFTECCSLINPIDYDNE